MEIRKIRLEKGIKQYELAREVGVSVSTVQLWENKVSKPSPKNMAKLKQVLEINEERRG